MTHMDAASRSQLLCVIRHTLDIVERELNLAILATPSGDERNALTAANIHVMAATTVLATIKE